MIIEHIHPFDMYAMLSEMTAAPVIVSVEKPDQFVQVTRQYGNEKWTQFLRVEKINGRYFVQDTDCEVKTAVGKSLR